ncbi:nuclear transport factor 2 family protein [Streptomyces djakartensis]|uniref:nuclear transport factor 2 family protein n=1 Tax=Streptomyces djakartensis TaxID=68193 RepID=UPI0034DF3519
MNSDEIYDLCTLFLHAYQERNLDTLRQMFNRSEELTVLGTHEDLCFLGWSAFETSLARQFSAIEDTDIQMTDFRSHVFAGGAAACAYATTNYRGRVSGQDIHLHGMRLTLTLERHDHFWRVVQAHWSIPADGSLLSPKQLTHQPETTASAPVGHDSGAVCAPQAQQQPALAAHAGFPSGARAAFTVYRKMASTATKRLNQGTFDFASDIAPHADEHFTEIANTVSLDLAQVRETFTPVINAIAVGASFSWSVQLEQARDLTPDITLLITTAQVTLTLSEGQPDTKRYRITNLLTRNSSGAWVFLHQHRTEIPAE